MVADYFRSVEVAPGRYLLRSGRPVSRASGARATCGWNVGEWDDC